MDPRAKKKLEEAGWHAPETCPNGGCDHCLDKLADANVKKAEAVTPQAVARAAMDLIQQLDSQKKTSVCIFAQPGDFKPSEDHPIPDTGLYAFHNCQAGDVLGALGKFFQQYPDLFQKCCEAAQLMVFGKDVALAYQRGSVNFSDPDITKTLRPYYDKAGIPQVYDGLAYVHLQIDWAVGKSVDELADLMVKYREKSAKKGKADHSTSEVA